MYQFASRIVDVGPLPSNSAIQLTPESLAKNVSATIGPYLWSLHYICEYLGWPRDHLETEFDEVADE
jgi:hypothetical protein